VNIKMDKITRITCDLDTTNISALIRCLKVFRRYKFTEDLTVRKSSSGNGYHVIAWTSTKGRTLKKLIKIRRKAGDDKIRCDLDLKSNRQVQVLFTKKTKKEIKNEKTKTSTNRINSIDV